MSAVCGVKAVDSVSHMGMGCHRYAIRERLTPRLLMTKVTTTSSSNFVRRLTDTRRRILMGKLEVHSYQTHSMLTAKRKMRKEKLIATRPCMIMSEDYSF